MLQQLITHLLEEDLDKNMIIIKDIMNTAFGSFPQV